MIKKIGIKKFKSIFDDTLDMGRINVLIGENGSGKTNILEAFATAGAALDGKLDIEDLYTRGVRITKPSTTISSFSGRIQATHTSLRLYVDDLPPFKGESWVETLLLPDKSDTVGTNWSIARATNRSIKTEAELKEILKYIWNSQQEQLNSLIEPALLQKFQERAFSKPQLDNIWLWRVALPELKRKLGGFCIYNPNPLALRGIQATSRRMPLGIYGENLDVFLESFTLEQMSELARYSKLIPWFDKLFIDTQDELKFKGHKLGRSTSRLYFRDRFMRRGNNVFSAENANEGILHILFYLALFLSDKTPPIFGIDNIETALNPQLCRELMKALAGLAKAHDKQALITTHNPAVLDGINLHDDDQRLFVVYRNDQGHTVTRRIKLKPDTGEQKYKLSELWMRGHLGGLPKEF